MNHASMNLHNVTEVRVTEVRVKHDAHDAHEGTAWTTLTIVSDGEAFIVNLFGEDRGPVPVHLPAELDEAAE